MNLVLFEDALMHLPGDPKNYSFAEFVGELEVGRIGFLWIFCDVEVWHKSMPSHLILIQDAHQPHHPAEAWQCRVPQKGPPWLQSDAGCCASKLRFRSIDFLKDVGGTAKNNHHTGIVHISA